MNAIVSSATLPACTAHFFSGRYPEPTLAGFVARIPHYYPRALGTLAGYVGIALALLAIVRGLASRAPEGARS